MYNLKKEYLRNRVKYINFLEAYIHLWLVTRALMMRRIRHVKESRQKDTMINWTSRSNGNMKYCTLLLLTKTHARVQTSLIELLCNRKTKLPLDNSSKSWFLFLRSIKLKNDLKSLERFHYFFKFTFNEEYILWFQHFEDIVHLAHMIC